MWSSTSSTPTSHSTNAAGLTQTPTSPWTKLPHDWDFAAERPMPFYVTSFQGCWLQARINPRRMFTVLPFSAVVDSRWGSTQEHVVLWFHLPVSDPGRGSTLTDRPFPFYQWHVTVDHSLFVFYIPFQVVTLIMFDFDDYTLSHNPHQFAYMPTFDTIECQPGKRDASVLPLPKNTHCKLSRCRMAKDLGRGDIYTRTSDSLHRMTT